MLRDKPGTASLDAVQYLHTLTLLDCSILPAFDNSTGIAHVFWDVTGRGRHIAQTDPNQLGQEEVYHCSTEGHFKPLKSCCATFLTMPVFVLGAASKHVHQA
jgi:hypothetical protein